jgi:hypothetical protein
MPKIPRFLQKIFASNYEATPIGQIAKFGSLAAGAALYTSDPATIQSLPAWLNGWSGATVGNKSPTFQDFNAFQYVVTRQLAYLLQAGIPEYDATTTYYIGSFCQVAGVAYVSIADNSTGNAVTNPAYWSMYNNVQRNYIDGLILSTAGSSASLTIGQGQASDSTSTSVINLVSSLIKTTSAWSVGSASGGLDTGAISPSSWYYFYIIKRTDTGVVDVVFSLNSSVPSLPASYTLYRYIGAALTNGSSQWVKFIQNGNEFTWHSPILDFASTGSTSAVLQTLSVPRGRKVKSLMNVQGPSAGPAGNGVYLSDPDSLDLATSGTSAPLMSFYVTADPGTEWAGAQCSCWTDTSGRVRRRHWNTQTLYIATTGWIDSRGQN